MRLFLLFLTALVMVSCGAENSVMSKKEFARVYQDSLTKRYPDVKFSINPDLSITSTKGDLDYTHFIDNAFIAYEAEPDSLQVIITQYMAAATDLFTDQEGVKISNIVPVIKPAEFLDEANALSKDGKAFPLITEKYNDQLIIVYAEDDENSIKYLTADDFKVLSISMDTLHSIALRNFDRIMQNIQIRGDSGLYMITAGGEYEASLILLSPFWSQENLPVAGQFIVAIPNRDLLLVTGSENKDGIKKIREIAADSHKTGNYPVSEHLYKWNGKRFELY